MKRSNLIMRIVVIASSLVVVVLALGAMQQLSTVLTDFFREAASLSMARWASRNSMWFGIFIGLSSATAAWYVGDILRSYYGKKNEKD